MTEEERKRQRDTYLLRETEKVRKILENLIQGLHMIKIISSQVNLGIETIKTLKPIDLSYISHKSWVIKQKDSRS